MLCLKNLILLQPVEPSSYRQLHLFQKIFPVFILHVGEGGNLPVIHIDVFEGRGINGEKLVGEWRGQAKIS